MMVIRMNPAKQNKFYFLVFFLMFNRILIFALTNIAVIAVISLIFIVLSTVFGINIEGNSMMGLLLISAVIGFGGAFISLALSRWSAKRAYNIVLITPDNRLQASAKEQKVYELIERIAREQRIKMPEVGIYIDAEVNAFATGMSRDRSLVAVSTALLEKCTQSEIDGVIAHELSHVLNWDMVTMTLLQWVLNTFVVFLARIIARIIDEATDGKLGWLGYQAVYLLLQIVLGLGATLIAMKFSRYREFKADLGSAQLIGKSHMIAALRRLQSLHPAPHTDTAGLSAFMISSGEKTSIFASHPSLQSRIQALEENYQLA
jgi:heat shock protein HtpX